jgi:uncharacterized protein (DUF697 family)
MTGSSVRTAVAQLFDRAASRLAGPGRGAVMQELSSLKQLVADARPPRLVIAGRPGVGAAEAVRTLFGDFKVEADQGTLAQAPAAPSPAPWGWRALRVARGELRILDLTGDLARDLTADLPPAPATPGLSRAEVQSALRSAPPDLILFLCRGEVTDEAGGVAVAVRAVAPGAADLDDLAEVRAWSAGRHGHAPVLLGVVLDGQDQAAALDTVLSALAARGLGPAGVYPLASPPADGGPALESLAEAMVEALPGSAQLQMVRLLGRRPLQEKAARRLTRQAAAVAAGIAAAPIPVADILPLTALQVSLVCGIGYAAGRELSAKAAREFLVALGANVGVAFTLREAARALVKVALPGGGSAISAGVAFAGTWGVGEAATAYFISGRPLREGRRLLRRFLRRGGRAAPALPVSGPGDP